MSIATIERLHYGSDYPFTPEFAAAAAAERLAEYDVDGSLRAALDRNSQRLFPELGG